MSAVEGLSRRERQILEILIERGKASASEVRAAMPDAPSYSAVRTLLRVLLGAADDESVRASPSHRRARAASPICPLSYSCQEAARSR